jgi:uncharacterized protein
MKPLVIYHDHCTDGFGAAFAAWLKLGDAAEYRACSYGAETFDPGEATCRDVYILDFSFPRAVMGLYFQFAKRVVWLDHHKTAFEMWGKDVGLYESIMDEDTIGGAMWCDSRHHIVLDNNKSGALLAWEYFHPGIEAPMLIKHIDDRDRWQFKMDGSKELHAALQSYKPWSFEQWHQRFTAGGEKFLVDEEVFALVDEGTIILRAQDQHVASMAKQARKCKMLHTKEQAPAWYATHEHWEAEFDVDARGLACNTQMHISEVGHELANQSGTYGLVWYVGADARVRCSLRSNGDYDVSEIAKAFGGGGHKNAAGFEADITTLMGWLV